MPGFVWVCYAITECLAPGQEKEGNSLLQCRKKPPAAGKVLLKRMIFLLSGERTLKHFMNPSEEMFCGL